jgi:Ca2+-transporting ATPase
MGLIKDQLRIDSPRVGEAPFDSVRKMMSTVHLHSDGSVVQYTKGAPDEVLKKCTHIYRDGQAHPLTTRDREDILTAKQGHGSAPSYSGGCPADISSQPSDYDVQYSGQELCCIVSAAWIDPSGPEVRPPSTNAGTAASGRL